MYRGRFRGRAKSTARFTNTKIGAGLAVLAKYGANAHLYLPGVGSISGIQLQNYLDSAGTTLATVDNPVGLVKDAILSGAINASQATTANKPTLRKGLVNLLPYSGDLTNAAWTKSAVSVVAGVADPDGGVSAQKLVESTENNFHFSRNLITSATGVYTSAFVIQAAGRSKAVVTMSDFASGDASALIDLTTGALSSTSLTVGSWTGISASAVPLGGGWWLVAVSATRGAGTVMGPFVYPANAAGAISYTGDGVSGVNVYRVGIFSGSITAQQILACGGIPLTTSAAASSTAGNWGWGVDGTKYFSLASVPFTVGDSFSVVIGARVDDIAANRTIYSHSNAANNQLPWIYFGTNGSVNVVFWDGTTTVSLISPLSYTGQNIVVGFRKSGTTATLRINGTQVATASLAAITNQGLTTATIAGFNGPNLLHVGEIFAADVCKANVTDADMLTQERMVGALTGPTGVTF